MDKMRSLTAVAAVGVLAGGVWHLLLWFDRYRELPSQIPGVEVVKLGFPVNAALSVAVAVALVALPGRVIPVLAGLGLQAGSIAALVDSRTSTVLGWEESVWDTPAVGLLIVEVLTAAALIAVVAGRGASVPVSGRSAAVSAPRA